jgi:phytoene dehydrogenase-like protein
VSDIRVAKRRAAGIRLADGTELATRAVISTLDLRRTFYSLFQWKDLPAIIQTRLSTFRHAPATARLLLALDAPPDLPVGSVAVARTIAEVAQAHTAWRQGLVPDVLPLTLRPISATDPRLSPIGQAVVTVTIGCIPYHPFNGAWTHEKRSDLVGRVLHQVEEASPGIGARILAAELIAPPDIADSLAITDGDLDGGEIAPDQMLEHRGFADYPGGRTPVSGLYLGGRCAPAGTFGSCAAGVVAARAVLADLEAGHLP